MENHVMVDIESLGTEVDSVILSISAVEFDIETGETHREFEVFIDIDSSIEAGRKISQSTLLWWMSQEKEARERVFSKEIERKPFLQAINEFYRWEGFCQKVYVWANSPRFDLGMIECNNSQTYEPWGFWNERDVRTLVSLAPWFKDEEEFVGTKHYGIDDCKHQIKYVSKTWNYINDKIDGTL